MSGTLTPPANDAVLDETGALSQSWAQFMTALATKPGTDITGVTAAAAAAQTTATAAQTAAATNATALAALAAISPAGRVGDYLQTAVTNPGSSWLLCDGSDFDSGTYPALYAVLHLITSPGATTGKWKLPAFPAEYDVAHPGPSGPAVRQTWVRAV